MKSWIASGLLLAGAVDSAFSQAVTSDVFRAQATFLGAIQFGPTPAAQAIKSVRINSDDLVNSALGREWGAKLQTNEVLAYASSLMTNTAKLLVYDPFASSNLATIGQINPQVAMVGQIQRPNVSEMSAVMVVPGAGNATNGLTGGSFVLDAKSALETNGAILNFNATGIGFLGTVVQATNFNLTCVTNVVSATMTNIVCTTNSFTVVGTNFNVLVRTATITTRGKKIGTLTEPP